MGFIVNVVYNAVKKPRAHADRFDVTFTVRLIHSVDVQLCFKCLLHRFVDFTFRAHGLFVSEPCFVLISPAVVVFVMMTYHGAPVSSGVSRRRNKNC